MPPVAGRPRFKNRGYPCRQNVAAIRWVALFARKQGAIGHGGSLSAASTTLPELKPNLVPPVAEQHRLQATCATQLSPTPPGAGSPVDSFTSIQSPFACTTIDQLGYWEFRPSCPKCRQTRHDDTSSQESVLYAPSES